MKVHHQSHPDMQRLGDRLEGQRIAMLTLREPSGRLDARPLTPLEMDASGAVWMLVSHKSLAPYLGVGAQPAHLAFTDEGKSLYVSIVGSARLVDDAARRQALWTVMARPWFSGADDPDLAVLCVQPESAEVWDGPDSSVMRMLAMAASVAAGKPIGLGEHEVVTAHAGASALRPKMN